MVDFHWWKPWFFTIYLHVNPRLRGYPITVITYYEDWCPPISKPGVLNPGNIYMYICMYVCR